MIREKIELFVDNIVIKGGVGGKVILMLRRVGITTAIRKFMIYQKYKKEKKYPTEKMVKSREFFTANKGLIKENIDILCDKKSKDIYLSMIKFRCTHDTRKLPHYSLDDSYFVNGIVPCQKNSVFVDCGAFTGDTVKSFIKHNNGMYDKIICFEPDKNNYNSLVKNTSELKNIYTYCSGVWSEETTLSFYENSGASSKVVNAYDSEINIVKIPVKAIDSMNICNDATFIKMDIEGAELEALKGAEQTIRKNRPILTICIYHSDEDMIRIPQYLYNLGLDYRFYIRQHGFDEFDTVMYAIPGDI